MFTYSLHNIEKNKCKQFSSIDNNYVNISMLTIIKLRPKATMKNKNTMKNFENVWRTSVNMTI